MTVSPDLLHRLAHLAALHLDPDELPGYRAEFQDLHTYLQCINHASIEDIPDPANCTAIVRRQDLPSNREVLREVERDSAVMDGGYYLFPPQQPGKDTN